MHLEEKTYMSFEALKRVFQILLQVWPILEIIGINEYTSPKIYVLVLLIAILGKGQVDYDVEIKLQVANYSKYLPQDAKGVS